MQRNLPSWVAFWLLFSSVVCAIDALFVLLRPYTLPGGKWNYLFKPYNIYIQVDTRYKDLKDEFVIGQSWMNLVEVCLNTITVTLHGKSNITCLICGLVVCTMTCAKTILFTLMATPLCSDEDLFRHVGWPSFAGMFVIPNSIWIAVPFLCISKLTSILMDNMENHRKKD